jgi:two-component system, LytTR family, response regulator
MLRAVIIDDEENAVISLELLIKKFVPEVKVIAKTTRPQTGIQLINDFRPDIVFLDIQMPRLTGFDILDKLEFRDFYLVFTTAYHEYALQALRQNATDYLLKPVNFEELKATIKNIRSKVLQKQRIPDIKMLLDSILLNGQVKVPIHTKNSIEYLLPKDVVYIEAQGRNTFIKLKNKALLTSVAALKYYSEMLCGSGLPFMRVHYSFIINLDHVTKYSKENGGQIVLDHEKSIPLSKKTKNDFLKYIGL